MLFEAFCKTKIFKNVPEPLLDKLFQRGQTIRLDNNEILVHSGTQMENIYFILAGDFDVFVPDRDNEKGGINVGTLAMSDCIGEYSLVDSRPASASLKARVASVVLGIPMSELKQFLTHYEAAGAVVYRNLLKLLVNRLRQQNEELDLFRLF